MPEEGRRDRRKRLTRTAIGEHGWRLFAAHGFDAVTIAQIADAADVAVGTVFNYFPSKEAILFDRAGDLIEDMAATVRERPPGVGVVAAFRDWHDRAIGFLTSPDAGERTRRMLEIVAASPALRAHEREIDQRYRQTLAAVLDELRHGRTDSTPVLLAGQLVTLHRTVAELARDLILAGTPARTVRTRVTTATRAAFSLLSQQAHTFGS
ncbi:TetR family transcriptional regulator [Actinocrispum sp. NPDC049592]|uniref:TetR/AcrR family transcriptional regulator n=1 Tax=Actinocrispum sp. NPDC049592 TaxID=3154835 RepID=UPI00341A0BC0